MVKALLRKILPTFLLDWYHRAFATLGAFWYGFPSEKMVVIGVTGTNGKSTTGYFIAKMLEHAGFKTGMTSTAVFKIADREWLNDKKMTMLGRFQLQRMLRDMVRAGCQYAVIETSSEGVKQYRHRGINYDVAVFTNLTPEHLETHGGFENYKKAKGELFAWLTMKKRKAFFRHPERSPAKQDGVEGSNPIQKTIVVNADDEHAEYFLSFRADQKVIFSTNLANTVGEAGMGEIIAEEIKTGARGVTFSVFGTSFKLALPGRHNMYNALAAIATVNALGVSLEQCAAALKKITGVPGRMEKIDEGQPFTVIVDYAPEIASMERLYETVRDMPHQRVIHVLGSCGGGRDRARRPVLGRLAGENADVVFVTNEDPYDDDPMEIINEVADGAVTAGKQDHKTLFRIIDRQQAIEQAIA
ncbi:MAG: UDP-N-acetylmuramoyl-L-alanyl-D-glutamate--2,6-diaminopimelate ligase, partial [Patescibacteria group bacterium]